MRERIHHSWTSPAFETEAALARVDGNRDLLGPMAALFVMQWRNFEDKIVKAIRHRDGAALAMTAHRLRESAASFGARQASRIAQDLEVRGRTGDLDDLEKLCASLHTAIDDLANSLMEFTRETT